MAMIEKLTNDLGREITLKEALNIGLRSWNDIVNVNPYLKIKALNTIVNWLNPNAVSEKEWKEILAAIGKGPFETKQKALVAFQDYLGS